MARFASSTAPLAADGEYSTGILLSDVYDRVTGSVFADQAGTVYIEQSGDGENWDVVSGSGEGTAVTADTGAAISEELVLPYYRVRFENGEIEQTEFRIFVRSTAAGNKY